jgi:CBS domain-containing protein
VDEDRGGGFVRAVRATVPTARRGRGRAPAVASGPGTAGADESLRGVAGLLIERGLHHVPVVESDRTVVGVVTTTDVTASVSGQDARWPARERREQEGSASGPGEIPGPPLSV